jgi:putative SOS response-associated peptidase YedK
MISGDLVPRYNAAPSQSLPVILNASPGRIVLSHWGIAPVWLSSLARKDGLINVRFENLRDRPTFRSDLALRRCLVLADGFYEWQATKSKRKIPYRITREDGAPFAFAGIWQETSDGLSPRFAIITTAADSFMAPIHSRMPVILDEKEEKAWIGGEGELTDFLRLLETPYGSALRMYEVSRDVNRAFVDSPLLIEPVEGGDDDPLFKTIGK